MKTKEKQVLDIYFTTTETYTVRTEQLHGKNNIVVPVVMMVEGVHSGSHGPILHLAEELGRYPESWDGIPVTIGHPNVNGSYVSANSPDVLDDWAVGRIFNTRMDGSLLRAEAWIDEDDLMRISEETLTRLNDNEVIEVSVGVFSDEETASGIWNMENYNAIARNHRPNHLALLPDEIGACSIEDGCGVRVNQKGGTKVTDKKEVIVNEKNRSQVLKELNRLGFSINEVGQNEVREKIAHLVYGFDGSGLDNYLEEVYSDYFVYAQFNNRTEPRTRKLYKQSYSIDNANDVKLNGEPIHVKKEVSYDAIPSTNKKEEERIITQRVIQKNNKKSMCTECVKKAADNLIANKATAWNEDDREYLESQTEEQLEKMTPPPVKEPEVNTAKPTREDVLAVLSEKPMTNEEFLGLASPEVRSQIEEGLELRTNQKNTLVSQITANTDQWTKEELEAKEISELQKLHKVVVKEDEGVYTVNGGLGGRTQVNTNRSKTVMLPPSVKAKMKTKSN